MQKIILRYGLYSGLVSAALMLFTAYQIKEKGIIEGGEIYGYTGMVLSMLFVFAGVKVYRDREKNGVISFGEAFKIGGLIALISCLFYVVTWMIVSEFITPDFMDKYIAYSLDKMKAGGAAEAEVQAAAAQMEQYKTMYQNPLIRFGMTLIEPLPVALLMSLLTAAILGKRQTKQS